MDGQRPMEELSEARNLEKVLRFRDAGEGDREFAVDEIIDRTGTTLTTVFRSPRDEDDVDQRKLRDQDDWEELFAELLPSVKERNPNSEVILKSNPDLISKLFVAIMRPDQTEKWALRRTDTLVEGIRSTGVNVNEEGLSSWLLSSCKRVSTAAASFLRGREYTLPNEKTERPITDLKTPAFKPPGDHNRKKLRNMPFTLDTFRTGGSMVRQKAIIYNCRSSNEWEDDMALTVTHFPNQKLTFAILFGASEEQERSVLARLRKAGTDTAHPMLLPGILAELERKRQMDIADEIIDELEMQIFQLDNETITSWNQSGKTTAERNRQKTKAWLDAAFSRNILLATKSLLFSMRRHLDETLTAPFIGMSFGSEYSGSETLVASDPDGTCDSDVKYQAFLQQASMRMEDRLISIIGEYDDKIRACTMEVDGMAMATQWSHGETNMEIATASGEDSSQMRYIALVTMVFLPGTFFASIFSMTFFNWSAGSDGGSGGDSSSPIVSSKIWIYFLITAVSTLITLSLFWYFILSRQRNRRKSQRDNTQSSSHNRMRV
ncbi:hypothetical protein VTI28DRAFT_8115 [Corynascus sepedonium]